MEKGGSFVRITSAVTGVSLFLVALFFLNKNQVLQATFIGVIGILLITISLFPFIRSQKAK